jgi:hypothetical protein
LTVCVQTGGGTTRNGTVRIIKHGPGTALIDDVGRVGVIAGMEPRLPGFAIISRSSRAFSRAP